MNRIQCPNCNDKTGLATNFSDGDFCFACKEKQHTKSLFKKEGKQNHYILPEQIYEENVFMTNAPQIAVDYLKHFYFTTERILTVGFRWHEGLRRIIYPVNAKACWGRSPYKDIVPKSMFYGDKTEDCYFRKNLENDESIVLVEDILSCVRVSEFQSCMSLCGTQIKNDKQYYTLQKYKNVILWLDGDIAGIRGAEKIKRDFKLYKNVRVITTKRDPKEFPSQEIKNILYENNGL